MRFPTASTHPFGMKGEGGNTPSSFSIPKKEGEIETKSVILVAQDTLHAGAGHGLISNGGKKSIGNYIIEFVANGSQFVTVQIYQAAVGITPKVQTWNKTKKVIEKKTVYKNKPKEKIVQKQFVNKGVEEF